MLCQEEEADWIGLSIKEAEEKQIFNEEQEEEKNRVPLKQLYLDDLIYKLESESEKHLKTDYYRYLSVRSILSQTKKRQSWKSPSSQKPLATLCTVSNGYCKPFSSIVKM